MRVFLLFVVFFSFGFQANGAFASNKNKRANYNINQYCQKIVAYSASRNPTIMRRCIQEETDAKKYIESNKFDSVIMGHCFEVADSSQIVGLGGSYTLLKTCIDHELEAIQRYEAMKNKDKPPPDAKPESSSSFKFYDYFSD